MRTCSKEKRLKLRNGIEVIIPEEVEGVKQILLQERDGELVEVEAHESNG